jgi:bacterial leucyl aminopeptidase
MGLMTDYTTPAATSLLGNIIKTYTTLGFIKTRCGYACTDNSAWYKHGYTTAFAAEAEFFNSSPNSDRVESDGSPLDTLETLNRTHVTEFAKSTVAFVVELSLTR